MTNADIENLSCGDVVLKEDSSGKHAYLVSFKSATGLCLTYCDASCVETQSYDKVGTNWQYNSEDLTYIMEPRMENIVDEHGHKRFFGGEINIENISGVTKTYGKWYLSGFNLNFVLCLDIANETALVNGSTLADIVVPKWIFDKIFPTMAINCVTYDRSNLMFNPSSWDYQTLPISLRKLDNNTLRFII